MGRKGMAGDIDREGVEKAYGRWAPVYDLVFGKVFDHGRQSTIAEADKIGGDITTILDSVARSVASIEKLKAEMEEMNEIKSRIEKFKVTPKQ